MLLIVLIVQSCYAITVVFICCELSEKASNAVTEITDVIVQFDWYLFPTEILGILPLIMINSQQTITMKCFGSILCNRECFKKVSIKSRNFDRANTKKSL